MSLCQAGMLLRIPGLNSLIQWDNFSKAKRDNSGRRILFTVTFLLSSQSRSPLQSGHSITSKYGSNVPAPPFFSDKLLHKIGKTPSNLPDAAVFGGILSGKACFTLSLSTPWYNSAFCRSLNWCTGMLGLVIHNGQKPGRGQRSGISHIVFPSSLLHHLPETVLH